VGGVVPAYVWAVGKWPACVVLIACVLAITLAVALLGWRNPENSGVCESAIYSRS
jgi:hypothetical protein